MADKIAEIAGKAAGATEEIVAVVHCSKNPGNVDEKFNYVGFGNCSGSVLAFSGPLDCQYGCVGFGECSDACQFEAIVMVNNFPVIDPEKCVGCGACVKTCPKGIIKLIPKDARVFKPCSTKDGAKVVKAICKSGCISDKGCVRKCPAKAISVEDGVIVIDHKKCIEYGPSCEEACRTACKKVTVNIIQPFTVTESYKKLAQKAA